MLRPVALTSAEASDSCVRPLLQPGRTDVLFHVKQHAATGRGSSARLGLSPIRTEASRARSDRMSTRAPLSE